MYWPAPNASPNTYALSKQVHVASVTQTHDGLDVDVHTFANEQDASDGNDANPTTCVRPASIRHLSGDSESGDDESILAAKMSRGGNIFATITRSSLTVWQAKPPVALARIIRSPQSMKSYGPNTTLLLRPDSLIIVLQTTLGYLITYTLANDPNALVYQTQLSASNRHKRRESEDGYNAFRRGGRSGVEPGPGEGNGIAEINLRFRMVIRIDAGISTALALDNELVVATQKPAALQTIQWVADSSGNQWSTDLVSKMAWMIDPGAGIVDMVHDRPMNLTCWIMRDGRTYAVQRRQNNKLAVDKAASKPQLQGYCFRQSEANDQVSVKAAINARFSLIAVGCASGYIDVYIVKDYMGNIPYSHRLDAPAALTSTGKLNVLTYSPDGYCLFAGYEKGWAMWSVYGKLSGTSFNTDRTLLRNGVDKWLSTGIIDAFWAGGGCELGMLLEGADGICFLDIAKSAATECLTSSNFARGFLHSSSAVMIYKGNEIPDLTSLSNETSLWQTIRIPHAYLAYHWPLKCSVISPDGHYIAVAGRRGLAHYSSASGRWKTFDNAATENEFTVRGGMCWWQHFLIVAAEIEGARRWQLRLYSREKALEYSNIQHVEELTAPAILITTAGTDSLLVYTHENALLHYIIVADVSSVKLVQVGQIGFHGIIRAPTRVRSISWILPDDQLEHGDPSQDVVTAAVLFLVDAKLVLLQPSINEEGSLKYDMRVIATNVEYYVLLRDQPLSQANLGNAQGTVPSTALGDIPVGDHLGHSLRDSLWYFDGQHMQLWLDIQDVLAHAPVELGRDLPATISIPLDFYPLGVMADKGIVYGIEADVMQRRDVDFSISRHISRTSLFLPQVLQQHLADFNQPAALYLSRSYETLPYFAHALEILLHNILDAEVDRPPSPPETALLPTVTNFLSSFPCYLDVAVNCTRKTELRSWRTLFRHLPPVRELFEASLGQGKLKTAAGYLLVLHTFAHEAAEAPSSPARQASDAQLELAEFTRLLSAAIATNDWDLCKELSRFLVGIDGSGELLRATLSQATLTGDGTNGNPMEGAGDRQRSSLFNFMRGSEGSRNAHTNGSKASGPYKSGDYFSISRQRHRSHSPEEISDSYLTPDT